MARGDWFRRTTWSATDRADFYTRLHRTRSEHDKAQYLRIQALHLQETGDRDRIIAAIELLDDMVARFPHAIQLSAALLQRAECFDALDRVPEAIESFRASVSAQRAFPNVSTRVAMVFGMFCIRRDLDELLPEAESYVVELVRPTPLPRNEFEANAVLALSCAQRGDASAASAFAARALDAARRTASNLPGHPSVGLVDAVAPALLAKLRRLLC